MQVCNNEKDIKDAFASVKRLSQNNFGNDGIFLEKFIVNARHIEIQIVGDGCGHIVSLGERDCSLQRRNQKVIEETPAPNLSIDIRDAMVSAAERLGKAVNYRSAGTVEFIFDVDTQQFYFLEMNTRLQVEHGVTELVTGVDLVRWMINVADKNFTELYSYQHQPKGHAIQARLYAEDPGKDFMPSSGLLTYVNIPESCRFDTYIETGLSVPVFYDPMLAKILTHADNRDRAIDMLCTSLGNTTVEGIVTNQHYLTQILRHQSVSEGQFTTHFLNQFHYDGIGIDVIAPGTQTTVQDVPGRVGYWGVGIPPSGPMDTLAFQLGNALLNNPIESAGLEMTLTGPTLRFRSDAIIALTGAEMEVSLDDGEEKVTVPFWQRVQVKAGSTLQLGTLSAAGMRSYLCIQQGLNVTPYLGSKSTFILGQFGGHGGRALQVGDVLSIASTCADTTQSSKLMNRLPENILPKYDHHWNVDVIYGPHGAPDFLTQNAIDTFFKTDWKIHFNSSRTGVRLIGPKPEWARADGGEAGLHPSNIHDNAYAIGAVDFTGDMPVILGPDGPSLGGFVCPVTIIKADLWVLGQLKPDDTIRFRPVSCEYAEQKERQQLKFLAKPEDSYYDKAEFKNTLDSSHNLQQYKPILLSLNATEARPQVTYRLSGDDNILIEYGPLELDLRLRFRVHALMLQLDRSSEKSHGGILELTPGIRSLQVHFNNLVLPRDQLLDILQETENELGDIQAMTVSTRTVYLPLSWDDPSTQMAIDKYMTTVNPDAPWCPSNIEFIRRINGLDSIDDVKKIVFDAHYLVMGLGDVYLGAPVATPLDPRHRLVTTKYNPARTWTPENAVGIGGAYMCVYGMEGPGGYQFVGRTVQMWNRYHQTKDFTKPWLLRFFDQIRFYEVSHDELTAMRKDFLLGRFSLRVEENEFSLAEYEAFLEKNATSINDFQSQQRRAFTEEREHWQSLGLDFDCIEEDMIEESDIQLQDNQQAIFSTVPGSLWKLFAKPGDHIAKGATVAIVESMKMEFPIVSEIEGTLSEVFVNEGQQLNAGQIIAAIEAL